MKILYVVNAADAQSIPLELGLAMHARHPGIRTAGYYARGQHPVDHGEDQVLAIGARRALDRKAIRRLWRLIRRERPDIIHMHHAVSALWCTLLSLGLTRRPALVKTEHNDHRFLPAHQTLINCVIYPFMSRIVCNSDTTLASFRRLENLLAGKRTVRIYNGVDIDRIRSRAVAPPENAATGKRRDSFTIGNVARLVPQKNQQRLIEGLAIARSTSNVDLRLEIVGEGPLRDSLVAKARSLGIDHVVTFAGGLPRDEVYEKLHRWDGFVMASNFEGFCNALVEAIAAGLPVAISDITTLREVAGPVGIRFDQNSPEAIAAALVTLSLEGKSEPLFAERYDIRRTVDAHLALYEDILT